MSYHLNRAENIMWEFKKLVGKELKMAELIKQINSLIVEYPVNRAIEINADEILRNVWLGNALAAKDIDFIKNKKINYIINVTNDIPNQFQFINYTVIPMKDIDACHQDLLRLMQIGASVINQAILKNEPILVHCKRGHHRSASVLALYLMEYQNLSLFDSIKLIKNIRPTAFSRMSCMLKALILYEFSVL